MRLRGGGCGASTPAKVSPKTANNVDHAGVQLLAALDDRLVAALESGAIKLVRAEALCDEATETEFAKIRRRQDLEELERSRGVRIFLTPSEAVAALRAKGRLVGGLTYGWTTPDHPDVSGMVLAAVRRFLRSELGRHVVAVFWDFASLPQKPRSPAEDALFKQALGVMGDVYASPLGTTVLRHTNVSALIAAAPRRHRSRVSTGRVSRSLALVRAGAAAPARV